MFLCLVQCLRKCLEARPHTEICYVQIYVTQSGVEMRYRGFYADRESLNSYVSILEIRTSYHKYLSSHRQP